jgi:hypothetical protein
MNERRGVKLGVILLGLALVALPVSAQDLTGTWNATVDLGSGGTGGVTLVLVQDGAAVSGTYSGSYGSLVPLRGTAEGGRVVFSFTTNGGAEAIYDGVLLADTMRGSVAYGESTSGTFEALMRPPATIVSAVVGYGVMVLLLLGALKVIFFPDAFRRKA